MAFQVSGKNLSLGGSLGQRARNRVQALVDRLSEREYSGHMVISREGSGFRADCTLHLGSRLHLQAEAISHDPYACVDEAVDRIGRRLQRTSAKLKSHSGPSGPAVAGTGDEMEEEDNDLTPPPSRIGDAAAMGGRRSDGDKPAARRGAAGGRSRRELELKLRSRRPKS